MTIPVWMLLGFAAWTLLLLLVTVGVYRWSLIFAGRMPIKGFSADRPEGSDWYLRGIRAHANCIENLPVFGAIVFALHVGNVGGPLVNALTIAVMVFRILQSLVHVSFVHTNTVAALRFGFFFAQFVCFAWLIGLIVRAHV